VGEAEFGLQDGVVQTRQGWVGEEEVVEVRYDPEVLSPEELHRVAKATAAHPVAMEGQAFRLDKEQKYYLLQSPLRALPMSETQACRVNASLEGDWRRFLSPAQVEVAEALLHPPEEAEE
jgi:hypothetical protein